MKFYKYILVFFLFFLLFININLSSLNSLSKENIKPKITIITPSKSEEYIISRPTIKATFQSDNKIKYIKFYLNNIDVTKNAKITKDSIVYRPSKKLKRGNQIVKIIVSDDLKNKTTLEWYFTVGTPIYKNLNGSFLCENEDLSKLKNDFYIISPEFYASNNTSKSEFKERIKNFNFVTLENFSFYSNKDLITTYKLEDSDLNHVLNLKSNNLNLINIYEKLFFSGEIICQFTPTSNSLNSFNYMRYSPYADKVFSLIDVRNFDENSKTPFYLNIYNEALNNGYHIAPVSSNFFTKILASDLNKDSLLDGLKNRRTYVTNNSNLNLEFYINNHTLGSIIKNPSKLNFTISAIDPKISNKINKICIVSNNGKVVKSKVFNSNLVKYEFSLDEFEKNSFYYLLIFQTNNKISVSAPVWVEND